MSKYIDGFVLPITKAGAEDYRSIAEKAGAIWMEHGALEYIECLGEDLDVKDMMPFPKIAGAGPEETVVFSWIVYESREHRDEVNKKVMADPRLKQICDPEKAPFDCNRIAYGGFTTIVNLP